MKLHTGSFSSLSGRLGAHAIADPLTLCLPAGSAVNHDTILDWVTAQRWPSGEAVLVPAEMAACAPGDMRDGYTPFTTPITNGLGAGPSLGFAIGHGLGELFQRDGNGLGFRAMDRGIVLDLGAGPTDPRTRALLTRFQSAGIEVLAKFASDEFGLANVYVVGGEPDAGAPFPLMVTACGEAASLDREQALRKALLEFASSRMRKSFSHMKLADIMHVAPPGYVERFRAYHSLAEEEGRALSAMMSCPGRKPAGSTHCRPGAARWTVSRPWRRCPAGSRAPAWRFCSSTFRRSLRPAYTSSRSSSRAWRWRR